MMILLVEGEHDRVPLGLHDVSQETIARIELLELAIGRLGEKQLTIDRAGAGQARIEALDREKKGLRREIRVLIQESPGIEYEEHTA